MAAHQGANGELVRLGRNLGYICGGTLALIALITAVTNWVRQPIIEEAQAREKADIAIISRLDVISADVVRLSDAMSEPEGSRARQVKLSKIQGKRR